MIPIGLAWKATPNVKGSWDDADFFMTIQSSVMNALGIYTTCQPTFSQPASTAKRWVQCFAALGILCAFGAIGMYGTLPTMWSALLSFLSSVIQAFMTMQLAIAVESPRPKPKRKDG
jgi:hypothetical protein